MNTTHCPTIITNAQGEIRCFSTVAKAHAFAEAAGWNPYSYRMVRPPAPTWTLRDQSEDRTA